MREGERARARVSVKVQIRNYRFFFCGLTFVIKSLRFFFKVFFLIGSVFE